MSNTILASLPAGVETELTIADGDGCFKPGAILYVRTIDGVEHVSNVPANPTENVARIGEVLADGSVFGGAYHVDSASKGTITMSLLSGIDCTVHDWCIGHPVREFTGDVDDRLGAGVHTGRREHYHDLAVVLDDDEENYVAVTPVLQFTDACLDVEMQITSLLTAQGVEQLAGDLERFAAFLRERAAAL